MPTPKNIKIRLHQLIDSIDDVEILKAMYVILKAQKTNNLVAEPQTEYIKKNKLVAVRDKTRKTGEEDYTKPGKPMSVEAFKKRILVAEERINKGEFITQEDLEKEMASYAKPGKPMSIKVFKKRIKGAQSSKSTSHEFFLKEIEKW